MRTSRFTEAQIVQILLECEAGTSVDQLARRHRLHANTILLWRSKYGGMNASDLARLRGLEAELAQRKRRLARLTVRLNATGRRLFYKAIQLQPRPANYKNPYAEHQRKLADAERPLLFALRDQGVRIASLYDLIYGTTPVEVIPLLLRHLVREYPYQIKDRIARCRVVKDAPRAIFDTFLREFDVLPGDRYPADRYYYKTMLGGAIGALAKKTDYDKLAELAREKRHGHGRVGIVSALPRVNRVRCGDVLGELLEDADILPTVIAALSRLRDDRARAIAEPIARNQRRLTDGEAQYLRQVARKYLKRLATSPSASDASSSNPRSN